MVRPALVPTVLLVAALCAVPGVQAQEPSDTAAGAARIHGVVFERGTRAPVQGVAIALRLRSEAPEGFAPPPPAFTDEEGAFTLARLIGGPYDIEITRIGYQTLVDSLFVPEDAAVQVEVELVPEALELDPIFVIVEPRMTYLETSGFYDRRARGFGRFIDRDEIEARIPSNVSDLLRTIPGIRVAPVGRFSRQNVVLMRNNCVPELYLDGFRVSRSMSVDELLNPDDVEAVEIYRGPAEMPPEFSSGGCGALVVWTRRGERGGQPFTWRRALVVLGLVGAVFLLTR